MTEYADTDGGGSRAIAHAKVLGRSEQAVNIFDRCTRGGSWGEYEIQSVKFKLADDAMLESLAIITGLDGEGGPVVAFHTAVGFAELFVGLAARLRNGTLKWRVDEYRT